MLSLVPEVRVPEGLEEGKEKTRKWFSSKFEKEKYYIWACYRHDGNDQGLNQNPYYEAHQAPCYAGIRANPMGKAWIAGALMNSDYMDYYDWIKSDKSPFKSIDPDWEIIERDGKPFAYLLSDKTMTHRWADVFNLMCLMRPPLEFKAFVDNWRHFCEKDFDPRDAFLVSQWCHLRDNGYSIGIGSYSGGHFPIARGWPGITYERWFNSELNHNYTNQGIFSDNPLHYETPYPHRNDKRYQEYLNTYQNFGRVKAGQKVLTLEQVKEEYGYHKKSLSRRG